MAKRKIITPAPTKAELKAMVEAYFEKGGVIVVCPTRYAHGAYRSTIVSTSKAR